MLLLAHTAIKLTGHRPILPASDAASVKPGDWLLASAGPVVRSTWASSPTVNDRMPVRNDVRVAGRAAEAGLRPGPVGAG